MYWLYHLMIWFIFRLCIDIINFKSKLFIIQVNFYFHPKKNVKF